MNRRWSIAAVLFLTVAGCTETGDDPEPAMRAAACTRKITPVVGANHSDPIYMAGFDNNRLATGVHDDTWARGVVIESGDQKIALVVLDVIGYFNNEIRTIRSMVADDSFDAIVVSSTHVHESADTMGLWGPEQVLSGVDLGYLDFVNQQVVDCIAEANANLVPAEIRFATGSTAGTSLPPEPDLVADGEILQHLCVGGQFEDGQCVDGIEVLGDDGPIRNPATPSFQLRAEDGGAILATVVNYASHPEALGSDNTLITSDFPHYMRAALEERFGGTALYVSADLGVLQGPLDVFLEDPDSGEMIPRRTFEFAQRMGEILAQQAGDALAAVNQWERNPEINVRESGPFTVTVENPYFQFLGRLGLFGRRDFTIEGEPEVFSTTSEAQVLRIGAAQFAITPNELDPQIGNQYRALMANAEHRFVVGLGNDEIGYQMPAEKFNPSCFLCFNYNILGVDPEGTCPQETNDCGTVFVNNIGPGTDTQLQQIFTNLLADLNG